MSQTVADETKNSHADSPGNITSWWHKFHFSGRVIMCSVLFGLGLVLIGGLIFAINMNDDDSNSKIVGQPDEIPTKAPSNYVGPVVMGIGGFIVIVGIIMCLFETQVCRKKSGDTSPLISGKNEDFEAKSSDPATIPTSSHCHKNHKHKNRKTAASPRKTKNKHGKMHSPEQKSVSSKSPPVTIDKSKSFMTSSEDNFLTPPNTLNEHAILTQSNSRDAENQTSASLMKSFTSSGPSWTQSTEFLTPSASFKDNSLSIENSIEIDEKQGQVNFKTTEMAEAEYTSPEYMTPLTVEEERIQKLFIRVKNEHMEMAKRQMEEKTAAENFSSEPEDNSVLSSVNDDEFGKNTENTMISTNDLSSALLPDVSLLKETATQVAVPHADEYKKSKDVNRTNAISDKLPGDMNISRENSTTVKNENVDGPSDINVQDFYEREREVNPEKETASTDSADFNKNEFDSADNHTNVKESYSENDNKEKNSCVSLDSPVSQINDIKHVSNFDSEVAMLTHKIKENKHDDLESSISSDETLISCGSLIEKLHDVENKKLSTAEGSSSNESKAPNFSESLDVKSVSHPHKISDYQDSPPDVMKVEKVGVSDLTHSEKDSKENNIEEILPEKTS